MARRTGVPVRRTRVLARRTGIYLDGVMVPRDMVSFVGDMVRIEGYKVPRAMIRDTVRMKRMARQRMVMKKRKLEEEEAEAEEEKEAARMILSEDERKKKLVYIFTVENTGDLKVVAFDPHEDESHHGSPPSRFIDKTSITEAMPPHLRRLGNYQFAALGSKLYFIGGVHTNHPSLASNRVFTFDMASQEWDDKVPCMKVKRVFSTVVTYENKIYVFGYERGRCHTRKPEQWAEFFDPQANAWNNLPGLPAPKKLRTGCMTLVATVLENHKKILLCIQNVDVYSYSVVNQTWCHENYPFFTDFGVRWSITVAVVKDTVFWNYFGNIFAFDFQPGVLDGELKCTIPNAKETFGTPSVRDCVSAYTYLVYAGNGKLCLVHDSQCGDGQYSFRCHTFQLRRSRAKKFFDLHYEGCATYQSKPHSFSVFTMAM